MRPRLAGVRLAQLAQWRNGDVTEAEAAFARIPVVLDPQLIGADLGNDEKFIIARAKFAKGISQRDAGKAEEALNTLIDSVKDMGEVVLGSSPRNQDQALLLAEAYTELADLIAKNFSGADAKEAHNQAVPILLELNRLLPDWAEVKYLLARNYGALAALSRDAGQPGEASKKKAGRHPARERDPRRRQDERPLPIPPRQAPR
jgi:hypothetical protein